MAEVGTYEELGTKIGQLVEMKQAAYGDSFGKSGEVMRILFPNGIPPERLGDALAMVRVVDKLFRLATDPGAFGESPWRDIAGYALLGAARAEAPRVPPEASRARVEALADAFRLVKGLSEDTRFSKESRAVMNERLQELAQSLEGAPVELCRELGILP